MNKYHTYDFPNSKCLVIWGDIHGDFNRNQEPVTLIPDTLGSKAKGRLIPTFNKKQGKSPAFLMVRTNQNLRPLL